MTAAVDATGGKVAKFVSIESLRGWMAWWVVIGHAFHISGVTPHFPNPLVLLNYGGWAVDVFIIISGFVIAHLLTLKQEPYGRYAARRAFRLYPIYLVGLILAIALTSYYSAAYFENPWAELGEMRLEREASQQANFWPHLIAHLAMAHGLIPDEVLPYSSIAFLGPAWSLSLEWQFYLIAPLLVLALRDPRGWRLVFLGALLVVTAVAKAGFLGHWEMPAFLPLSLEFFLLGIACRLVLEDVPLRRKLFPFLVLGAVLVISLAIKPALIVPYLFVGAVWGLAWGAIGVERGTLFGRSRIVQRIARLLFTNAFVLWLGRISYSTYLIHIPILTIMVGVGVRHFHMTSHAQVIGLTIAAFPVILLSSHLLYTYVERPFIRLGAKVLDGGKAVSAKAAASPASSKGVA